MGGIENWSGDMDVRVMADGMRREMEVAERG
jgi:hypothetical protein